jgi:hypothetical protein
MTKLDAYKTGVTSCLIPENYAKISGHLEDAIRYGMAASTITLVQDPDCPPGVMCALPSKFHLEWTEIPDLGSADMKVSYLEGVPNRLLLLLEDV